MNDLVSQAQSAFIKKICIHDNFMYVRNLARQLHRKKTPDSFVQVRHQESV